LVAPAAARIGGLVPHGVDRRLQQRGGCVQAVQLEGHVRVEQQIADGGGHPRGQWKRLGQAGHVDIAEAARREIAANQAAAGSAG
jgi:acyl-[acyl carrier protein]--UDP-N-acetylglucosamine O-acyltransferase